MPLIQKNFGELNNDTVARLINLGYTDAQYTGTAVRNVVESIDIKLSTAYANLYSNLQYQYISVCPDDGLDALALLVGLTRRAGEIGQNFRVRIANAWLTASGANMAAMTQALMGITNIRNVIPTQFTNGIGTLTFYITGITGIPDASTVALAQSVINSMSAGGSYAIVTTPIPILLNVSGNIATSNSGIQSVLNSEAQLAIVNYVNSLSMGQPFIVDALIQNVLNADSNILDFSIQTISTTDVNGNTVEQLIANYTPLFDQELQPGSILIS